MLVELQTYEGFFKYKNNKLVFETNKGTQYLHNMIKDGGWIQNKNIELR